MVAKISLTRYLVEQQRADGLIPAQLRLLLDSLANYERRFRVARNVILLDDSIEEGNRDTNRDLLREFARAVASTPRCRIRGWAQ